MCSCGEEEKKNKREREKGAGEEGGQVHNGRFSIFLLSYIAQKV